MRAPWHLLPPRLCADAGRGPPVPGQPHRPRPVDNGRRTWEAEPDVCDGRQRRADGQLRWLARLLEGTPVTETRLDLAGVSTSLLRGGDGPPIVLLHGQGGFAAHWAQSSRTWWRPIRSSLPTCRGLGRSKVHATRLDAPGMVAWLDALIGATCTQPRTVAVTSVGEPWRRASRWNMATGPARLSWSIRARSPARFPHPARWPRSSGTTSAEACPTSTASFVMWPWIPNACGRSGEPLGGVR